MTEGASFARNHLQKYGWEEGKGLGRTESGITDAIKPKLKFDTAGVGHNAGDQFSFHWWDHVFNKAAKNIEVKNSDEGVSVKQLGKKDNLITNKKTTTQVKSKALMYGSFVKCGVMKPGGQIAKDEQPSSSSSSDDDDLPPDSYEGNDERLFKACGGRTAHKGARHGLHLSGKLRRIEEQENLHGNRKASPGIIRTEKESLSQEVEIPEGQTKKKKKKKRSKAERNEVAGDEKRCLPGSDGEEISSQVSPPVAEDDGDEMTAVEEGTDASKKKGKKKKKRSKERRGDGEESPEARPVLNEDNDQSMPNGGAVPSTKTVVSRNVASKKVKKSKKRKRQNLESVLNVEEEGEKMCGGEDEDEVDEEQIALLKKKKKKSKRKGETIEQDACISPSDDRITSERCVDEQRKLKKLKKQKREKDHICDLLPQKERLLVIFHI